jgi:hypothetical protein
VMLPQLQWPLTVIVITMLSIMNEIAYSMSERWKDEIDECAIYST